MQNNTLARPGPSLSGTALKRIACLSMLIDHIGAALLENGLFRQNAVWQGGVRLDFVMRMAGRLAFPIYCFLLVEGFVHTHDFRKYALRMLGFALLSEFPFDWAFFSGVWWGHQNVYFTLLLGLLAMKALDTFRTGEGTPDARGRAAQCIAGAVFTLFEPVAPLAFGLVWFYSGERGSCSRAEQWAFYWFYPVHLFLLAVLTNLLLFQK